MSPSVKHQQHEAHLSWRIKSVSLWFFFSPVSEKNYSRGESAGLYDDIVFWNVKVAGMWSAMSSGPCTFRAWKEPFRAAPLDRPSLHWWRKGKRALRGCWVTQTKQPLSAVFFLLNLSHYGPGLHLSPLICLHNKLWEGTTVTEPKWHAWGVRRCN